MSSALTPRQWGPCAPTVTLLQLCPSPWDKESAAKPVPLCRQILHPPCLRGPQGFQRLCGLLFWIHPWEVVKPPTCSPQARWMVKRELCSRGSKLGVQARVSWRKRSRKTTGRGYPLVPATQVRGRPDLRPCPPVGSCRYILPPLFGLEFLNEKRIDINFSQPPMA